MQVYLIRNGHGDYKIGFTSKHVLERVTGLQTASSSDLTVVATYKTKMARRIEGILHRQYGSRRLKGEWFALTIEDETAFEDRCRTIERNLTFLDENKIGL